MFRKYKFDFILIGVLLFISIVLFLVFNIESKKDSLIAYVYSDGILIETIDLNKEKDTRYIVLDNATIEVKNKAIRIKDNDCISKYCIKQGWTNSSYKPIVCLYNNIYIKIVSNADIDVVVG